MKTFVVGFLSLHDGRVQLKQISAANEIEALIQSGFIRFESNPENPDEDEWAYTEEEIKEICSSVESFQQHTYDLDSSISVIEIQL